MLGCTFYTTGTSVLAKEKIPKTSRVANFLFHNISNTHKYIQDVTAKCTFTHSELAPHEMKICTVKSAEKHRPFSRSNYFLPKKIVENCRRLCRIYHINNVYKLSYVQETTPVFC